MEISHYNFYFGFFENFQPVRPNVHGSTSGNNVVTYGFIQNL